MFERLSVPKIIPSAEIMDGLNEVLSDYLRLANNDPSLLRLLIPSEEIWRFFIDGILQQWGWQDFEQREPGYTKALYGAFQELFDFSTELSPALIKRFNKIAAENVKNTNYDNAYSMDKVGLFRGDWQNRGGFGIVGGYRSNISVDGLIEFLNRANPQLGICIQFSFYDRSRWSRDFLLTQNSIRDIRSLVSKCKDSGDPLAIEDVCHYLFKCFHVEIVHNMYQFSDAYKAQFVGFIEAIGETRGNVELAKCLYTIVSDDKNSNFNFHMVTVQPYPVEEILTYELVERIKKFNQSMRLADTPIKKLTAIAAFIQSCEQLHPFADANCRTFCMLLLNYLLMRHKFPLVMLDDPNRFDCYSIKELLAELIQGMKNTFTLIKTQQIHGVKTSNLLKRNFSIFNEAYFNDCVRIDADARERPAKRPRQNY